MKTKLILTTLLLAAINTGFTQTPASLETAPPVIVKTSPIAGTADVDPALTEIRVTFSKTMKDKNWSWSTWGEKNFPEIIGSPRYLEDGRTCVVRVKLEPGKYYAIWLNNDKFHGFKDADGRSAVPYLLTFTTAPAFGNRGQVEPQKSKTSSDTTAAASEEPWQRLFNDDQRTVLAWTDRQFRSYFDSRSFEGRSESDRTTLETRLLDAVKGPRSREYYQAINTLGALRSTNALPALRQIAYERADKNNRDRWMAIRSLGMIGDQADVPELIHLVYHGNVNTRWWAQLSLVRLTGKNFGSDWNAWGKWWNEQNGQPPYRAEIIRWWSGQPETEKLAETLAENDRKFLADARRK